ncbi:MAG: transglutaminase domain-containing protein [Planctomycetota bacterium]
MTIEEVDRDLIRKQLLEEQESQIDKVTADELIQSAKPGDNSLAPSLDLFVRNQRPVGYRRVSIALPSAFSSDADKKELTCQIEEQLAVRRGLATFLQQLSIDSRETASGELKGFESNFHVGPLVTRDVGEMDQSRLSLKTYVGTRAKPSSRLFAKPPPGFCSLERALRTRPVEVDQTRRVRVLLPRSYDDGELMLSGIGQTRVPSLDGEYQSLMEIATELRVDENVMGQSVLWVDSIGQTRRSYTSNVDLLTYRVDQETLDQKLAEADLPAHPIELNTLLSEKLGRWPDIERPTRVAVKMERISSSKTNDAELPNDTEETDRDIWQDWKNAFASVPDQLVRDRGDALQVLISRTAAPAAAGLESYPLEVRDEDRKASSMIDFASPKVKRIVDAAIPSRSMSKRDIALELTSTAYRLMQPTNDSRPLLAASRIAAQPIGNSVDHAIFLTAMLRSKGIPSRVVMGMQFVPQEPAQPKSDEPRSLLTSDKEEPKPMPPKMVFHAWSIAHVDDKWMHLDATTGEEAAADCIGVATSAFAAADNTEAFLPLLQIIGDVKLTVLGVR